MFKVDFGGLTIFEAPAVEPAVAFALEIHRASNVPHTVTVFGVAGERILFFECVKPVKNEP